MEQIHAFEEENRISFSSRKALVQFVAKYIAFLYKEHCRCCKAIGINDQKEMIIWEKRIEEEVAAIEKAVKKFMDIKRYFRKNMKLTRKSIFFKEVFKEAKIATPPQSCIPCNVEYEINDLVFKKDVKI